MVDFTKESIQKAIEKIDQNPELRNGRGSIEYDLTYQDKRYPPILVLSEASKLLGGEEIVLNDFGNSTRIPFKILENLGFIVRKKTAPYYDELKQFLEQAETNNLKTSHYLDSFLGLRVKVSFGQGSQARVPWIAFLDRINSVSYGIYPVYLFYKSKNLLILAYGVSETNTPSVNWPISNGEKISQFFFQNNLGVPERYGESFVFKTYNTTQPLNREEVDSDINELISFYKETLKNQVGNGSRNIEIPKEDMLENNSVESKFKSEHFSYHFFHESLTSSNLFFDKKMCLRFTASLLAKPFVILTGLSGSGKTKLAQSFCNWICESTDQFAIVPVGADWTNREPLLGFSNALKEKDYVKPENRVLDLIINANKNPDRPYFLLLDEMNLSHVERYFADFLSVMESGGNISLHEGIEDWNSVPAQLSFPKNLFVIGTVNIDETTYMFSPKVLDRANVIEFRVTKDEMNNYLQNSSTINLKNLNNIGVAMAKDFVLIANEDAALANEKDKLQKVLLDFFIELKKTGAEFGYRTVSEIFRFAAVVNKVDANWNISDIIDVAIMQKLLPKVHGSRRKLEPTLKTLATLCLHDGEKLDDYIASKAELDFSDSLRIKYPIALEKILRMYENLVSNGFTSYAEA